MTAKTPHPPCSFVYTVWFSPNYPTVSDSLLDGSPTVWRHNYINEFNVYLIVLRVLVALYILGKNNKEIFSYAYKEIQKTINSLKYNNKTICKLSDKLSVPSDINIFLRLKSLGLLYSKALLPLIAGNVDPNTVDATNGIRSKGRAITTPHGLGTVHPLTSPRGGATPIACQSNGLKVWVNAVNGVNALRSEVNAHG